MEESIMDMPLTHADRALFEQRLRQRRDETTARRLAHLGGQTRAEHAHEVLLQDGDDAPQRDADREIELATTDREYVDLIAIDAALQRLAQGTYGLCSDCAAYIPRARLELEPQALRCVACETVRERGRLHAATL
jgi:DnaK suppressor protein